MIYLTICKFVLDNLPANRYSARLNRANGKQQLFRVIALTTQSGDTSRWRENAEREEGREGSPCEVKGTILHGGDNEAAIFS